MCRISSFFEGFALLLSGCKVEVFGRNSNRYPSKGFSLKVANVVPVVKPRTVQEEFNWRWDLYVSR
jgi:hypothetical protein